MKRSFNPDPKLVKQREYYAQNIERIKALRRKYRARNKKQRAEYDAEFYKRNKDKIIAYKVRHQKTRRHTDVAYRLKIRLRARLWNATRLLETKKSDRTLKLLGCSAKYLKSHLESKFQPGMGWDNYGFYGWHIDHIKPCSAFDLTKAEEQRKCFNYTNLQPLWWRDNIIKGDRI